MKSNYDNIIPSGSILFSLRQIQDMGLIKVDMAKKLISKNQLEIVKIGAKIHISREVLINFLEANTIPATM